MSSYVTAQRVADALYQAIPRLACVLPRDIACGLLHARAEEKHPRGCAVLDQLLGNAAVSSCDAVPICQDTGTVWCSLEVGPDVSVPGDIFSLADSAVAQAYDEAGLRKSLVADAAFNRANTGNNTPAFCDVHFTDVPGQALMHIMLKGGGSDNASRVVMLAPGAGKQAIVDQILSCVKEKGANACPPLLIGVGIGGTFDKVAGLAKHALMRRIGDPAPDEETAQLEAELLEAVNASGVGPGGLGGAATALALHVQTAPCHIAALPLAINMGCSALRRVTIDLASDAAIEDQIERQLGLSEARDAALEALGVFDAGALSEEAGSCGLDAADASNWLQCARRIRLPLSKDEALQLRAGDACLLSGPVFTLRDAGHALLLEEMRDDAAGDDSGHLPYGLDGQAIFYAGPTPERAGRPFGAVGPTTSSRMDFAAPALYDAGLVATIGKGKRSAEVHESCVRNGAVYFTACGGAAALLARQVVSAETLAYADLGTEALRKIELRDFPVFVGIDAQGNDIFDLG